MSYSRTRATTGKKIASKSSKKTLSNKITDPTHMKKYVHAYEQRQDLLSNIDKINKNITYNTNELQSLPNDSSELSNPNPLSSTTFSVKIVSIHCLTASYLNTFIVCST